jgi:prepilin-type N-terminal cleavage/methylation domain-containing protein
MNKKVSQAGFTIVELMVATLVFSTVLLVVTIGIIRINRVYYKGLTETNTQNTTRTLMDAITQAIQFSGGTVTTTSGSGTKAFCVGSQQFSYKTGTVMSDSSGGIVRLNSAPNCTNSTPVNLTNGTEFMSAKMRLADLQVSDLGNNLYKVHLRVVYGADDLLNNPTGTNATCKGATAGSQFCSVSELTSTVAKRVQ